jgi:hypothetical protein
MANIQIYRSADDEWATSAEIVLNEPIPGDKANLNLGIESKHKVQFVVFVASTPEGRIPPYLDSKLTILDSNLHALALSSHSPDNYLSTDQRLAILVKPSGRSWTASIEQTNIPVSVSAMALHPTASRPTAGSVTASPPLRCRVCKSTAKALALAIVAAAAMVAMPAALIAAVAAFLGVAAVAAAAFINSVLGDTAAVIADKLCTAVGLCP